MSSTLGADGRAADRCDLVVVGAGIVGLAHAAEAVRRGLSVVVVERDQRAVGASVRNFGHGCVTAQAGRALDYGRVARRRWIEMGALAGFWVDTSGTVVAARADDEMAVLDEFAAARPDDEARLIGPDELRALAPIAETGLVGGAHLPLDVRVDPGQAVPAIARWLARQPGVRFLWSTSLLGLEPGLVLSSRGTIEAGHTVVCVGHDVDRLFPGLADRALMQRCALRMLRVAAPDDRRYAPAVLTGTSLLRYGGFTACPSSRDLQARFETERPDLIATGMNLMFTQRPDGDLTVGDTHEYAVTLEPTDDERFDRLVQRETAALLGVDRLRVRRRWRGVYASAPDDFLVATPVAGARVVSVTSGIGMTTAFGLAPEVLTGLFAGDDDTAEAGAPSGGMPSVRLPFEVPTEPAPGRSRRKVLHIGIDGVNVTDLLDHTHTPHLHALIADGVLGISQHYGTGVAKTESGPGWATIASGVWPDRHGVVDNSFAGSRLDAFPDWLTRLEQVDPAFATFAITNWDPLAAPDGRGPVFSPAIDVNLSFEADRHSGYELGDRITTAVAAAWLRDHDSDAHFVYLGNVDIVGHHRGAGPHAPEYLAAIERVDELVGDLVAAVRARPGHADEDWLILVSTDHGHRVPRGDHGGDSLPERTSFLIAAGGRVPQGTVARTPTMVDAAVTALDHLGVAIDPAWQLDGVVIGAPSSDPFDALAPGSGPPAGWSVDTRGWVFTTAEAWAPEANDQRENFLRARDMFAVADPASWSGDGRFDSNLLSAPWSVDPGSTVTLAFDSHYRHAPGQTARVLVSFDDADPVELLRLPDHALNQQVAIEVDVPPDAGSLVVHWHLTSEPPSGYWAIDNPRISAHARGDLLSAHRTRRGR
jgi:FAD dependent oxidoreductase TIGR03364